MPHPERARGSHGRLWSDPESGFIATDMTTAGPAFTYVQIRFSTETQRAARRLVLEEEVEAESFVYYSIFWIISTSILYKLSLFLNCGTKEGRILYI